MKKNKLVKLGIVSGIFIVVGTTVVSAKMYQAHKEKQILAQKARIEAEQTEIKKQQETLIAEKQAKEKAEQDRLAKEKVEKAEQERIAKDKAKKSKENYPTVREIERSILKKYPKLDDFENNWFSIKSNKYQEQWKNKYREGTSKDTVLKPYVQFDDNKKGYLFTLGHTSVFQGTLKECYDKGVRVYTNTYLVDTNYKIYDCDVLYDLIKQGRIKTVNCDYEITDVKVDASFPILQN